MENDTIQKQSRMYLYTNKDVLDQVTDDVCRNEAEKQALAAYKSLCDITTLELEAYLSTVRMIEILPVGSDEFKMYKRYKKYIEAYRTARNAEFEKLESDENIKYPLQQAWSIFCERHREEEREQLENRRKKKEAELEKTRKQNEKIQEERLRTSKHYQEIDNVLSTEQNLRYEYRKKVSEAEHQAKKETRSEIVFIGIAGLIGIVILTILFYWILPIGNFWPHLLLAIVIVVGIATFCLVNNLKNITIRLCNLKEQYRNEMENNIVKMYHQLLNGSNLYDFLGVPEDITFDSYKSLPKEKNSEDTLQFGKYTRYVSPFGTKYHMDFGCSTAVTPAHLFALNNKEPCSHCIGNDHFKLPEWYIYLKKLQPVIEKYPFLFDLSIKPYV